MRKEAPGIGRNIRCLRMLAGAGILAVLGACGGDDSPTGPPPAASWSNSGFVWEDPYVPGGPNPSTLRFKKSGGFVYLQGTANAGPGGVRGESAIGYLPEGFRPDDYNFFLCPISDWTLSQGPDGYVGTAAVAIDDTGLIWISNVHHGEAQLRNLQLDGLCFSVADADDGWTGDGVVWSPPFSGNNGSASRLEYLKIGDVVHLRGKARSDDYMDHGEYLHPGQIIATLPPNCRPQAAYSPKLLCVTYGWPSAHPRGYYGTVGLMIDSDGVIRIQSFQDFADSQAEIYFGHLSFGTDPGSGEWTDEGVTWTAPYAAGVSPGSTFEYLVDHDIVLLSALANAGGTHVAVGQTVLTLPAACRPPAGETAYLLCPTWGWPGGHSEGYIGTAGVAVLPDGTCNVMALNQYAGQQQYLHFDSKIINTAQ